MKPPQAIVPPPFVSVNGGVKASSVTEEEVTTEAARSAASGGGRSWPISLSCMRGDGKVRESLGMGKMRELAPIKALVGIMAACREGEQEILVLFCEFEEMHHA